MSEVVPGSLIGLLEYAEKHWRFEKRRYPDSSFGEKGSEAKQQREALRHIVLHLMAEAGRIAEQLQNGEHDPRTVDYDAIDLELIKLFYSATRGLVLRDVSSKRIRAVIANLPSPPPL